MRPALGLVGLLTLGLGLPGCGGGETSNDTPPGGQGQSGDQRITVYYGLNDSHSRDWAQLTTEGIVGISYFQRSVPDRDDGALLYRTIRPDGSANTEQVTTGRRLEKSVLLFDARSDPHVFVARSDDSDQTIDLYRRSDDGQWRGETIIHFRNEGGRFIYELSGATGPDGSVHLLILKTRSDIDSADFMEAWRDSSLYHLTDAGGSWEAELIRSYDMAYTYDMYVKSSIRQDIQVDGDGYVHVVFSEQVYPAGATDDPSRLWYATNRGGVWAQEIALAHVDAPNDDAGWFPSLALDNTGMPHIASVYVNRVGTGSATYARLLLLERLGNDGWRSTVIADRDDGYYGGDGRAYTGGLAHLTFDASNVPHIAFSDIASTHWPGSQALSVGNVRYGVYEAGAWTVRTVYRQPLPTGFHAATEMFGLVLLVSEQTSTVHIVGQELVISGQDDYTCNLIDLSWEEAFP